MTFEYRARQAARGLQRVVGPIVPPPIPGAGVIAPVRRAFHLANLAQVAAALLVVAMAAGYFSTGGFFAPFFGEALAPVLSSEMTSTTEGHPIVVPDEIEPASTTALPATGKETSSTTTDAPVIHEVLILSPADGFETKDGSVVVTGQATPGLHVVVNGQVAGRDDEGGWTIELGLEKGWNTIIAKGFLGDDRAASNSIDVYHEPPVTTTTTKPKPAPAEYSLHITTPSDGAAVDGTSVLVEGESTPGLTVYLNGKSVEWIDATTWKVIVPLAAGWNTIAAKGYQGDTKVALDTITVHLGEFVVVPFTANQVYGSSSENPPYEMYHGTATPSGKVWVQSPYGEKTVYADGEGNFEVTIHFEGVPSGKTFEVSVKDYDKREYKYFSFTYSG